MHARLFAGAQTGSLRRSTGRDASPGPQAGQTQAPFTAPIDARPFSVLNSDTQGMKAISALIGVASLTFSGILGASNPQGQSAQSRPFAATFAEFTGPPMSAAPRKLAARRVSPPRTRTPQRSQTTPRSRETSRESGHPRSGEASRLRRGAVKGSFVWPTGVKATVVRPFDPPARKWLSGHRGVDLDAPEGGTVVSAGAGTVVFAGKVADKDVVSIDHGGLRTTYEPVRPSVSAGDKVKAGDPIGVLEAGHCVPASCLHWGARIGKDRYIDPLSLLYPAIRLLK